MSEPSRAVGAAPEAGSGGTNGDRGTAGARSGLLARIALGMGALGAGLTIVFTVLLFAVVGLRHRTNEARQSQEVIATANGLQTLLIDFETGLRGFVIWNQEKYLAPWRTAREHYPTEMAKLIQLTANEPRQHAGAREIKREIDSYLITYSVPLVTFLKRNPGLARPVAAAETGSGSVQKIRQRFARFLADEERLSAERDTRARTTAHNALVVGLIAGWLAGLVMKGGGYGILGDIVMGIIGALVGGFLFGLLMPGSSARRKITMGTILGVGSAGAA